LQRLWRASSIYGSDHFVGGKTGEFSTFDLIVQKLDIIECKIIINYGILNVIYDVKTFFTNDPKYYIAW